MTGPTFELLPLDCRQAMRLCMAAESIDSIVTDPPYDLTSIVKRFGSSTAAPCQHGTDGAYARASRGFMGQLWDGTKVAFDPDTWREAYRVLKPGGHLLAFGGTRTYHRMVCAIEDAGFEIRDQIQWIYGSGFPKSHSVSKNGGGDQWDGWGTALKPAHEPIVLARKPLVGTVAANVLAHGTGGINIDGCRVGGTDAEYARNCSGDRGHAGTRDESDEGATNIWAGGGSAAAGRFPANVMLTYPEETYRLSDDATPEQIEAIRQALAQ